MLSNILQFVHQKISQTVCIGDTVIDATAGNGHDTVFLAQLVGRQGRVWAFDVQSSALASTQEKLQQQDLSAQVSLIQSGHECMEKYCQHGVKAIMFNLGYLPGADKQYTTQAATSLQAIKSGLSLLAKNGLMSIVLYPGHAQGKIEAQTIENWVSSLSQQEFAVLQYRFINRVNDPPYALLLHKRV